MSICSRREFLGAALLARRMATAAAPEYLYLSAVKLAQQVREKKISATELVKASIARIEEVNPRLNAVVQTCFERALREAKEADDLLARGQTKGPLHGVPMTIKDSLDTEGVITTGGTVGRLHYVPKQDATVVARLRAAGAILVGKSNTPEFTLAGGGIPGGRVVGSSDKHGAAPKDRPVHPSELAASVYHALGVDSKLRLSSPEQPALPLAQAEPVDELFQS